MESVITTKRIKLSDLLNGRESSCTIPVGADSILISARNDEDITVQFLQITQDNQRVLRNVKDKYQDPSRRYE